jgi:hypothetical protein
MLGGVKLTAVPPAHDRPFAAHVMSAFAPHLRHRHPLQWRLNEEQKGMSAESNVHAWHLDI